MQRGRLCAISVPGAGTKASDFPTSGDAGRPAAAPTSSAAAVARAPVLAAASRDLLQREDARREGVAVVFNDAVELPEKGGGVFVG
jgi:hypothetical protein